MSKKKRSPRKAPEVRRKEILATAAKVFARHGYGRTDVQKIADKLGVAKGTVYFYFNSKHALFLAVVERGIALLGETIGAAATSVHGPVEQVKAVIRTYLQFYDEHRELVEILAQERSEFREHVESTYFRAYKKNIGRFEDVLREGIASGIFRRVDPKRMTEALANMLHGTVYARTLKKIKGATMALAEDIIDLFFHGILSERNRRNG